MVLVLLLLAADLPKPLPLYVTAPAKDVGDEPVPLQIVLLDDGVLVVLPAAIVRVRKGKPDVRVAAANLHVAGVAARLDRVILHDYPALFALDLQSHKWIARPAPEDPVTVFVEADEIPYVIDGKSGRATQLPGLASYPAIGEPDFYGRYAWIADTKGNGGVFDVQAKKRVADMPSPPTRCPVLGKDGRVSERAWKAEGRSDDDDGVAIGRTASGRFRFFSDRVVSEGSSPLVCFDRPVLAAGFDREALRLAVAFSDEIAVITLNGAPKISERFPLPR